jgi:hypothetical protein
MSSANNYSSLRQLKRRPLVAYKIGMKNISFVTEKIRDHIREKNLSFLDFRNEDEWNLLCVSLDNLEDSIETLEYFEINGFGNEEIAKYICFYGVFQAIIIQQDSIKNLSQIFNNLKIELKHFPYWFKIRNLRNSVSGHPTQKGFDKEQKRIYLSRNSIEKDGFDITIWDRGTNTDSYEHVDFKTIYSGYKIEVLKVLKNIYNYQIKKFKQ